MNPLMYDRLVGIIHRHRTWVDILESSTTEPTFITIGFKAKQAPRNKLRLYAKRKKGKYPKGHKWSIPESNLDSAVRYMKSYSSQFKTRWVCHEIHPKDAEHIVKLATHGCLDLELNIPTELMYSYYNDN